MNKTRKELIKEIYAAIDSKEIVNGDQLSSERELCEHFQVKRGALREALVALEALGVIDIRERQGIFLENRTRKHLVDGLDVLNEYSPIYLHNKAMEARLLIEPYAAKLAAERCTPHQSDIILQEIQIAREIAANYELEIEERAALSYTHNTILHNTIVQMADNMVLANIYRYVSNLSRDVFSILGKKPSGFQPYAIWPEQLLEEHNRIVVAITANDPLEAEKAMIDHLHNSQRRNETRLPKESLNS